MTALKTKASSREQVEDNTYSPQPEDASQDTLQKIKARADLASLCKGKLNKREIISVKAVVAYLAYTRKLGEETVLSILTTAFGVESVEDINRDLYEEVIRFLVDFNFEAAFN